MMETEELECQFFNFSAAHIVCGIKETLDRTVDGVLESVEKKLVLSFPPDRVRECCQSFKEAYNEKWEQSKQEIKEIVEEVVDIKSQMSGLNEKINNDLEVENAKLIAELENAKHRSEALVVLQGKLTCLLKRLAGTEQMVSHLSVINEETKNLADYQSKLNHNLQSEIDKLNEDVEKKLSFSFNT